MGCIPSQFYSKVYYIKCFIPPLPVFGRISLYLHHIVDSILFSGIFVLACNNCLNIGLVLSSIKLNTICQYLSKLNTRYGVLVLFLERSIFRTAEKHGIFVLDLEHSNYLPHIRGILV